MSSRLLIILGDNDTASIGNMLGRTYGMAAQVYGASVHYLNLNRLCFGPVPLPQETCPVLFAPDLREAQELLRWADHTVWTYSLTWGGMPALLKCFTDRVFIPEFAYQGQLGTPGCVPLLSGKSADILVTLGSLPWYNRLGTDAAATRQLRQTVLQPAGMGPVRSFTFGPARRATAARMDRWTARVVDLAAAGLGQAVSEETLNQGLSPDFPEPTTRSAPLALAATGTESLPGGFSTNLIDSHVRTSLFR